jgi:vinculin
VLFNYQKHEIIIENLFQVSRLIILHEESADDGNLIPDLSKSVQVVKSAVDNLVKVGHETCSTSTDDFLRADMPQALTRVNQASTLLIDAAHLLKYEPNSIKGRQMLIKGARCK